MSIFDFFTKESLLNQVISEIDEMFAKDKKMFHSITDYLFEGKAVDIDIKQADKELNVFEINIRKKIFEHLSMNPQKDLAFSLIIIDVARDTERIGDYCKNLYKTAENLKPQIKNNSYWQELAEMKRYIADLIEKTHTAFRKSDKALAESVIASYREKINLKSTELINKAGHDDALKSNEVAAIILTSRYFRRITAHLINIATSVVNEFPKMRYTRDYKDV